MTFHCEGLRAVGLEARWEVVVPNSIWVEPILEACAPAAVSEHASIPNALERRDLVIAGASASLHGEAGIRSHGDRQDIEFSGRVRRDDEAFRRCEFVAGIEWRRVAHDATLILKDLLAA